MEPNYKDFWEELKGFLIDYNEKHGGGRVFDGYGDCVRTLLCEHLD